MSTPKIHASNGNSSVVIDQRRSRTAPPAPQGPSFGAVMSDGANVLLRGVETAAGVVGGPLMSGAVASGRMYLDSKGITASSGSGGPLSGGAEDDSMADVRALQEQAQSFNLQYLQLQEEIQQENRRFSTLSNVLKAKHDSSKAVIQNIRS